MLCQHPGKVAGNMMEKASAYQEGRSGGEKNV